MCISIQIFFINTVEITNTERKKLDTSSVFSAITPIVS